MGIDLDWSFMTAKSQKRVAKYILWFLLYLSQILKKTMVYRENGILALQNAL